VRIALLSSAASVHTTRWVEGYTRLGHDVRVFSLEPPLAEIADRVETVHPMPLPGFLRYPVAAPAMAGRIGRYAPDVIDSHFVPNYGLIGALLDRHPLAVNCWGSDLLLARDPFRRARARWVLARADRVRVDAENLAEAARALGASNDRLTVCPWGIDVREFAFISDREARHAARERWPTLLLEKGARSRPVVMSTRVLHPIYDVETLIRAWSKVTSAVPEALAVIVGDGPERAALEEKARRIGVRDSIVFVGRVPPRMLPGLLRGTDVYVSTSLSDSTSLSLLEAMAVGAYPVVSDISGNREWVGPETSGLFPAGDDAALARLVIAALGSLDDAAAARVANRRVVEARGDWGRYLERVVGEFETLLAGARKGSAA